MNLGRWSGSNNFNEDPMNQELTTAFNKVKIDLLIKGGTFFSTVAFSLKTSFSEEIATAGTDGVSLIFNPNFFLSLSKQERLFLYLHEISHVIFMHMLRGKDKDKRKYNMAADYVINIYLQDLGYTLIDRVLVDPLYRGMSTEEVYKLLPDVPDDSDYECDITPMENATEAAREQAIAKIESILVKATTAAKMDNDVGNIPAEIERYVEELLNPKLSWQTLLQNYMNSYAKEDYSMQRANRRYLNQGIHLPSLFSESLEQVIIAIDTSGSVTPDDLASFISEITYLREAVAITELVIIDFDTRINNIFTIMPEDDLKEVTFKGGGGTSLTEVFAHATIQQPKLLIVFSDLLCRSIKETPDYDVLWICVNNPEAEVNFGELIHIQML